MNRAKYRKSQQQRPALKALVENRPPRVIGWEYVYPAPEPCAHEAPDPCDEAARYLTTPSNLWDEEGP